MPKAYASEANRLLDRVIDSLKELQAFVPDNEAEIHNAIREVNGALGDLSQAIVDNLYK